MNNIKITKEYGVQLSEIINLNKVNNNMAVSGVKYSLCALMHTLTSPMSSLSWLLSSILMLTDRPTHLIGEKFGNVRSLSYGPEPNWHMYTVSATIQLMFGQE